jgi:catechol 2,3-dioxygenase-like lactoylglutathione lyase family enzyme
VTGTSRETSRIFRVLLLVRNLKQSQRFYETLLATPGRAVGGGRVYFDCGSVILALLDRSSEGESLSTLPEPLYFATTDLEGVHRRARRLGCLSSSLIHNDPENPAGEIVVRPWGERSFYAADPSGNPLCFVDSLTLFAGPPSRRRAPKRTQRERVRTRTALTADRRATSTRDRKRT